MIGFRFVRKRSPDGRYVINSLPKSGTHLLARVFDLLGFRKEPDVTLTYGQFADLPRERGPLDPSNDRLPVGVTRTTYVPRAAVSRLLNAVRPGHCVLAHLPFHTEWPRLLEEHGVGIVTIVRDPRDVVVSEIDGVLKNRANWLHRHFHDRLLTWDERFAAMTEGTVVRQSGFDQQFEPLAIRIRKTLPWLEFEGGSLFRFEALVGPRGGGDGTRQITELSRLMRVIDLAGGKTPTASRVARNAFGKGSKTFNRGKVGRWNDKFTPSQREYWDAALGDLTRQLGYPGTASPQGTDVPPALRNAS